MSNLPLGEFTPPTGERIRQTCPVCGASSFTDEVFVHQPTCPRAPSEQHADYIIDTRINAIDEKDVRLFLMGFVDLDLLWKVTHHQPLHRDDMESFRKRVRLLLDVQES